MQLVFFQSRLAFILDEENDRRYGFRSLPTPSLHGSDYFHPLDTGGTNSLGPNYARQKPVQRRRDKTSSGSAMKFTIEVLRKRLPVIANAVEQRSHDGTLLSTRLIVIKATDRRRYERELVNARTNATKLLKSERETAELREQFIAVLGHDLRNALAAIGAGARILQRSGALLDDKQLCVLDLIATTITRMSGLIDDVLDFARGRLGGGTILNKDADRPLEPTLQQIVEELRAASAGRIIETRFEIGEPVDCDRTRIGQLVSNLIGNALTHGASNKPVQVGARTQGGIFELWVANAGEPIPKSAIPKLFEPFFRGDVRDSRQGLGLGLYIASQIARAHGGRLAVSSTLEETCFTFIMPSHP